MTPDRWMISTLMMLIDMDDDCEPVLSTLATNRLPGQLLARPALRRADRDFLDDLRIAA